MTDLLPCPFCGALACSEYDTRTEAYTIWCGNQDCAVGSETGGDTFEEARDTWNRRFGSLFQEPPGMAIVDQSLITRLSDYFHVNARPENDLAQGYIRELDEIIRSWGSPVLIAAKAGEIPMRNTSG